MNSKKVWSVLGVTSFILIQIVGSVLLLLFFYFNNWLSPKDQTVASSIPHYSNVRYWKIRSHGHIFLPFVLEIDKPGGIIYFLSSTTDHNVILSEMSKKMVGEGWVNGDLESFDSDADSVFSRQIGLNRYSTEIDLTDVVDFGDTMVEGSIVIEKL